MTSLTTLRSSKFYNFNCLLRTIHPSIATDHSKNATRHVLDHSRQGPSADPKVAGEPRSTESTVLETGAAMTQANKPFHQTHGDSLT
jgi:hypothetical protein